MDMYLREMELEVCLVFSFGFNGKFVVNKVWECVSAHAHACPRVSEHEFAYVHE